MQQLKETSMFKELSGEVILFLTIVTGGAAAAVLVLFFYGIHLAMTE